MMIKPVGRGDEQRLVACYRGLDAESQRTLLRFAEFLGTQGAAADTPGEPVEPCHIPRPPRESVVAAIKRLSQTYPMLDRSKLLNDASSLMSSHVLHGRPAPEVIDDLEALFARFYDAYCDAQGRPEVQQHIPNPHGAAPCNPKP